MRKIISIFSLIFFIFSCTDKKPEFKLNGITEIHITDKESGLSHTEKDKQLIGEFLKVFDGQPESFNCTPAGTISFIENEMIRLTVEYSTDGADCKFLILDENGKKSGYRMRYQVGMYLSELFYELKKKDDNKYK